MKGGRCENVKGGRCEDVRGGGCVRERRSYFAKSSLNYIFCCNIV